MLAGPLAGPFFQNWLGHLKIYPNMFYQVIITRHPTGFEKVLCKSASEDFKLFSEPPNFKNIWGLPGLGAVGLKDVHENEVRSEQ